MNSYLKFLLNPNLTLGVNGLHSKIRTILQVYFITFFLVLSSIVFLYLIFFVFGYSFSEIDNYTAKNSSYYMVFLLIFLGPVIEELIFRLFLTLKKKLICLSLSVAIIRFLPSFSYYEIPKLVFYIQVVFIFLIMLLIYFVLSDKLIEKSKRYFNYIFYFSATLFALVHIKNYTIVKYELIFVYPVLILPQFFIGLALGYIRIKNGFFWGLFLHIIFNSIPAILMTRELIKI